jgi:predicted enzyme related to lactoylglutathione lyase
VFFMANPVTWFEIIGKDSAALQKFYRDVFRWKLAPPIKEMGNYSMVNDFQPGIGGGIGGTDEDQSRVSIYIEVDDPQKYLDKAVASGAELMMPVTTVTPTTTIAIFRDPAGNTTGILKAQPRQAASATTTARARSASNGNGATRRPTSRPAAAKKSPRKTSRATAGRKRR